MGSQSDWQTMKHAAETLDALEVSYDTRIVSAHRTPERLYAFAKGAKDAGFKVIIAGAGGAAHLPGMTASLTSLPVFGVPVESKALSGQDSLYSIVQMPPGIPVGTLAIGQPGAINAALLAASVLALQRRKPRQASRSLAGAPNRLSRRSTEGQWRVSAARPVLAPGATIGILGSGQLGRMLAMAAARLGFRCHIFSPEPEAPAVDVAHRLTTARTIRTRRLWNASPPTSTSPPTNLKTCRRRRRAFSPSALPVLPDPNVLAITQDRLAEKNFVAALGIRTAPFAAVGDVAALAAALAKIGRPAVLKTRRFGYDGKGQAAIGDGTDPAAAWREVGGQALYFGSLRAVRSARFPSSPRADKTAR